MDDINNFEADMKKEQEAMKKMIDDTAKGINKIGKEIGSQIAKISGKIKEKREKKNKK